MISRRSILALLGLSPLAAIRPAPTLPFASLTPEEFVRPRWCPPIAPETPEVKAVLSSQVEETIASVLSGGDVLPWEYHVERYPELYPRWKAACITRGIAIGCPLEIAEGIFG
jgi:hypothetical protein